MGAGTAKVRAFGVAKSHRATEASDDRDATHWSARASSRVIGICAAWMQSVVGTLLGCLDPP